MPLSHPELLTEIISLVSIMLKNHLVEDRDLQMWKEPQNVVHLTGSSTKIIVNSAAEPAKMLSALRLGCSPDHVAVHRCSPWRSWASVTSEGSVGCTSAPPPANM